MTDLAPMAAPALPQGAGNNVASRNAPRAPRPRAMSLTRKQKAAIIVRLLANEGADVPLAQLDDELQAELTKQMGRMRYVDRVTLQAVVTEFATELDSIGLAFPGGLAGALKALDGKISPQTAARLRKEAGVRQSGDPWERIRALSNDRLLTFVQSEATEVSAVLLSKLPTDKAALLLSSLPGPEARRITYAISLTKSVTPSAVERIGVSLAAQLDQDPLRAFDTEPTKRVGAILNFSSSATREALLSELADEDETFAAGVRKSIFTFADIPTRIAPLEAGAIQREANAADFVTALAYAMANGLTEAADHLLNNMSRRLSDGIREEINERGEVSEKDGEAAMNAVVGAIRALEDRGELTLIVNADAED